MGNREYEGKGIKTGCGRGGEKGGRGKELKEGKEPPSLL